MRKLFKERKLFKGGNYMRKYGIYKIHEEQGKKAFKCDICDQSFSQKGNLSKHTASVHDSNNSFYKCDICDQIFL